MEKPIKLRQKDHRSRTGSRASIGGALVVFAAIAASGFAGWFIRGEFEGQEEIGYHAELLRPWLAYDPNYYKRGKRDRNPDHKRVAFLVYQAYADGCDLNRVLDRAMDTSQVPPNLKRQTILRLIENHEQRSIMASTLVETWN